MHLSLQANSQRGLIFPFGKSDSLDARRDPKLPRELLREGPQRPVIRQVPLKALDILLMSLKANGFGRSSEVDLLVFVFRFIELSSFR